MSTLRQRRMNGSQAAIDRLAQRREKLLIRVARLTMQMHDEMRRIRRLAKHIELPEVPLPDVPKSTFRSSAVTLKDRLRERAQANRAAAQ